MDFDSSHGTGFIIDYDSKSLAESVFSSSFLMPGVRHIARRDYGPARRLNRNYFL